MPHKINASFGLNQQRLKWPSSVVAGSGSVYQAASFRLAWVKVHLTLVSQANCCSWLAGVNGRGGNGQANSGIRKVINNSLLAAMLSRKECGPVAQF